jgi:hypothetical protein
VERHCSRTKHFDTGVVLVAVPIPVGEDLAAVGDMEEVLSEVKGLIDHLTGEPLLLYSERGVIAANLAVRGDRMASYLPVLLQLRR